MSTATALRWIETVNLSIASTRAVILAEGVDEELQACEDALVVEMLEAHAVLVGGRLL